MINNNALLTYFTKPVREVECGVGFYSGSTLLQTYKGSDKLKSLTLERVGEDSKFFGFGICQKLNIKLIDMNNNLSISGDMIPYFGDGTNKRTFPRFHNTETNRDEKNRLISITAYDLIEYANHYYFSDLNMTAPYTVKQIVDAVATKLGTTAFTLDEEGFTLSYPTGANLGGNETLRDVLNMVAEITQTIYYVDDNNVLTFKRLNAKETADYTINSDLIFDCECGENRRLQIICNTNQLGDSTYASTSLEGSTQFVRDNGLWNLRADLPDLLDNAVALVGNMTINQFSCNWRGNPLLEIGDKLAIAPPNQTTRYSYLLDDVYTFDGGLTESTQWTFTEEDEKATNPTSLRKSLEETYARVNKADKRIDLVIKEVDDQGEQITSIEMNINGITSTVNDHNERLSVVEQTNSEIKQTIAQHGEELDEYGTKISQIEQTTGGLTSTVATIDSRLNDIDDSIDSANAKISTIEQTANSITATVNDHGESISTLEQTADSISSTLTSQGEMINQIKQDVDGISLTGYVKFNDLSTAGSTTINGSNITTGTINADVINVTNLHAANLKGLIPSGCISDSNNYINTLYATNIYSAVHYVQSLQLVSNGAAGCESNGTLLKPKGVYTVKNGTPTLLASWEEMAAGGSSTKTAVFG